MDFFIKDAKEIYIDDILFDTINGYKFYYKNNQLYFKIINEVTNDDGLNKIRKIIKQLAETGYSPTYKVKLVEELKYEDGSKREVCTYMECKIPDGDVFEFNCGCISNMGFDFKVIKIK